MKALVAIDGSAASLAALRWVLRQAEAGLACELVLLNVQEPPTLYEVVTAHDPVRIDQVRRDAGADLLRAAEALLQAAGRGYELEVAGGAPQHLIVELAENHGCDTIVLGARGQGDADAGGLGRVAQGVLHEAGLPVVVVRDEAR